MIKRRLSKTPDSPTVIKELIAYDPVQYEKHSNLDIEDILKKINPERVNWVNLDGLHDKEAVKKIQSHFGLHALLIDDVLNDQRPKVEDYEEHLYVTLKMLYRIEGNRIDYEQISFVLGNHYLISFQEKPGDPFDHFRERIRLDQGRVRKKKADYLLYRLIDTIIDNYYSVLDAIGDHIEEIEESLDYQTTSKAFLKIQKLKKELIFLRKAVYPLRDALSKLTKGESGFIEEDNFRYFNDVYEHVVHLIDSLDTYMDLTSGLMDIHINTQNNQLNKVIKVLTIISTIFIPLTFIVGVYGMNFDFMPELRWHWGYFVVWGFMIGLSALMLGFFKFKKWF